MIRVSVALRVRIYQIRCKQNGQIYVHKGWTWKHDADQAFE